MQRGREGVEAWAGRPLSCWHRRFLGRHSTLTALMSAEPFKGGVPRASFCWSEEQSMVVWPAGPSTFPQPLGKRSPSACPFTRSVDGELRSWPILCCMGSAHGM